MDLKHNEHACAKLVAGELAGGEVDAWHGEGA